MDGSIRRIQDQVSIQPAASRRQSARPFQLDEDDSDDAEKDSDEAGDEPQKLIPQQPPRVILDPDLSVGRADQDEAGTRLDVTA